MPKNGSDIHRMIIDFTKVKKFMETKSKKIWLSFVGANNGCMF